MVLYCIVLYCMVWYGMVWYSVVWYGIALYTCIVRRIAVGCETLLSVPAL